MDEDGGLVLGFLMTGDLNLMRSEPEGLCVPVARTPTDTALSNRGAMLKPSRTAENSDEQADKFHARDPAAQTAE